MNRANLQLVRDRIADEPPENFSMRVWHCGTAHCIGGWAQLLGGYATVDFLTRCNAMEFLDLTRVQAEALFEPLRCQCGFEELADVPKENALGALDSLITAEDDDALPVWPSKVEAT